MIEFKNVCYKSKNSIGGFDILKDIDVKIEKGSFVCLIGKNGSGKTTFGKLIKGILPSTSGEVLVNGKVNVGANNNVGYIFTNPESQMALSVVEDDIAFGLENLQLDDAEIELRVHSALKDVNMERYIKAQISSLSKGEQQKIVVAGILAMNYDVIVFDEAVAMLDNKTKDELMKMVIKLNKVDNKTIIFITHNLEDAMFADKVLLLDCGNLVFDGSKKDFFKNEELKADYNFDFPDVVNLVNHYRRNGYELECDDISSLAKEIYSIIKDRLN